ncbi:MAG: DUF4179 domain-containing protein, partial [Oscillospiraceae bacterium]|nr:DUF4179 domain-containing protein [Oscillospiraceae bacterium]
ALCIGTVGVSAAMNYEWIKSFFEDDFAISEDIESLVAETSNYECYSNCGIKMSLDGVIADEQSIYCQFNIDEMPAGYDIENLYLWELASESYDVFGEDNNKSASFYGSVNDEGKYVVMYSVDTIDFTSDDKIAIHLYNHDDFFELTNGKDETNTLYDQGCENYPYDLMTVENLETYNYNMDYVLIKFDLHFDDVPVLEISSDQMKIQNDMFNKIKITPFKMLTTNYTEYHIADDVEIVMDNGEKIVSGYTSFASFDYVTDEEVENLPVDTDGFHVEQNQWISEDVDFKFKGTQVWEFKEPINPKNVAEIYIGDKCIYTK